MCFKEYKGIEGLQSMFKDFADRRNAELKDRTKFKDAEACAYHIGVIFKETCARQILFGGYFEIGDDTTMYVTDIELYYHEEKGNIKDYVMYHILERYKKTNDPLPYFDLGTLNLHQSGIDITFENPEQEYRASFLIRGYKICRNGKKDIVEDEHPTHIYDDLFPYGFPVSKALNIVWHSNGEDVAEKEPCIKSRKNVCQYSEVNTKIIDSTDSGKFLACKRGWRFSVKKPKK